MRARIRGFLDRCRGESSASRLLAGGILAFTGQFMLACGPDVSDPNASAASSGNTPPSCAGSEAVRGAAGWSRSLGQSGRFSTSFSAASVAALADGSFAVASIVTGPLRLDCVDYPAIGDSDLLVARFDADGSMRFAQRYGARGLSVTAAFSGASETGVQFLVASAQGSVPIQLGDRQVPAGLFLASFDATGALRSATGSHVDGALDLVDVAFAPTGIAYVGGNLDGRIDFDAWSLGDTSGGDTRALIASWEPDGSLSGAGFRDEPERLLSVLLDGDFVAHSGNDLSFEESEVLMFDTSGQPLSSRSPGLGPMQLGPQRWIVGGYFGGPANDQLLVAVDPTTGEDRWQLALVSWSASDSYPPPSTREIAIGDPWIYAAVSLNGKADFGIGEIAADAPFETALLTVSQSGALHTQRRVRSDVRDLALSPDGRLAFTAISSRGWADADLGEPPSACDECDQAFLAALDP